MRPSSGEISPDITAILPVYRCRETLAPLAARLLRVFEAERLRSEILFVDDACPEGSGDVLRAVAQSHPEVVVVSLEENRGQHRAVLAGLRHARGKVIAVLDADLQDPPEALPLLLAELRRGNAAVFAGRRGRYESLPRLATSRLFKTLLSRISGVPADAGMFFVMTQEMAAFLLSCEEAHPFVVAMIGASGLPVSSIPVERLLREGRRSSYTSWMRLEAGGRALVGSLFSKRRRGTRPETSA